jgi:hypothetical protein
MGFLGQSDSLAARADPHKLAKAQILNMSDLVQVISVPKGFFSSMSNIVLEIHQTYIKTALDTVKERNRENEHNP